MACEIEHQGGSPADSDDEDEGELGELPDGCAAGEEGWEVDHSELEKQRVGGEEDAVSLGGGGGGGCGDDGSQARSRIRDEIS